MIERVLLILEAALLIWLVVQGEYICFYEREVYRIHAEREKERREWREAKRKQQVKKIEVVGE